METWTLTSGPMKKKTRSDRKGFLIPPYDVRAFMIHARTRIKRRLNTYSLIYFHNQSP